MVDFRDLFDELNPPVLGSQPVIVAPPPPGLTEDPPGTAGTLADPFHWLTTAFERTSNRNIALRGGTYNEAVHATGFSGTDGHRILIQPWRRERVTIDCYEAKFADPTDESQGMWEQVQHGSVREFVWSEPMPAGEVEEVDRGAFLSTHAHTRLITYDHLEDLLADNEFDPRIVDPRAPEDIAVGDDPPGDNHVWELDVNEVLGPTKPPKCKYRNWVYMGPGLWFDVVKRHVHLRLSHTHNDIPGWPGYTGITDPRRVNLALSKKLTPTLFLTDCDYLIFKDLTLRFGGRETVRIKDCSHLEFDHVHVRAGSRAIRFESDKPAGNTSIVWHDSEIDGGMPTWFFRSDRKDEYRFVPATEKNATKAQVQDNLLGKSTTAPMISTAKHSAHMEIHHCEIFNGHDVCLFGHDMRFHHNWVHNINDDALFMGSEDSDTKNAWIYRNVITQVLTVFSFASKTQLGQMRIFRNLIDIREPTLGIRRGKLEDNPFRMGQFYKSNGLEGKIDWWHNTCLVLNAGATFEAGGKVEGPQRGWLLALPPVPQGRARRRSTQGVQQHLRGRLLRLHRHQADRLLAAERLPGTDRRQSLRACRTRGVDGRRGRRRQVRRDRRRDPVSRHRRLPGRTRLGGRRAARGPAVHLVRPRVRPSPCRRRPSPSREVGRPPEREPGQGVRHSPGRRGDEGHRGSGRRIPRQELREGQGLLLQPRRADLRTRWTACRSGSADARSSPGTARRFSDMVRSPGHGGQSGAGSRESQRPSATQWADRAPTIEPPPVRDVVYPGVFLVAVQLQGQMAVLVGEGA